MRRESIAITTAMPITIADPLTHSESAVANHCAE